jgi:hypothetical protein
MDRREFGKLVGAVCAFPTSFLKKDIVLPDPTKMHELTQKQLGIEQDYLWVHGIRVSDDNIAFMDVVGSMYDNQFCIGGPLGGNLSIAYKAAIEWACLLRIGDIVSLKMSCEGWEDWTEKYQITYISNKELKTRGWEEDTVTLHGVTSKKQAEREALFLNALNKGMHNA